MEIIILDHLDLKFTLMFTNAIMKTIDVNKAIVI